MSRSLYLVNPAPVCPSYFGAEVFEQWGFSGAQGIADLATPTVAAMAPQDWDISICDEFISPIDFDHPAEIVGITGKITQGDRMVEVANTFRAKGKTVVIGGPYASLSPEQLRPHCDVLVVGELEGIADELFSDLESGSFKAEYVTPEKPDITTSPLPRWDLYPNARTLMACVQTSRGCPFECEFCDVIQYLGRKQRHKTPEQIITELDQLYDIGYRSVFLADDNFTAYRKKAKELLAALAEWNNSRPDGPVSFNTQVSIDAAKDMEMMEMLAEAGMTLVFIGVETPNVESLKETKKRQNVGIDLTERINVFVEHGISVVAGMIVGFDNDTKDIFQVQYDFAMQNAVPIFTLGALVAPAATPLFDRMEASGRLTEDGSEVAGTPWDTNIVHMNLTKEEMFHGLQWLCNSLYTPEAFTQRMIKMIETMGPLRGPFAPGKQTAKASLRPIEAEAVTILKKLIRRSPEERKMWSDIMTAMAKKPDTGPAVMLSLFRYAQVRCLYESGGFWEPRVTEQPSMTAVAGDTAGSGLVTLGSSAAG
ncbi:MAG: radical SAM protein [bacterium]|nr:radical SAM protein [bacterium]